MFILHFTTLIMNVEKIVIKAILSSLKKKGLSTKAGTKEINDVESPGNINEYVTQNRFRYFMESNTSLEDKQRSGRHFVEEDEAWLKIVEQQPSTSPFTLSAEFSPTQSTINRHLHKLDQVNRCWNIWNMKYCKMFDSCK